MTTRQAQRAPRAQRQILPDYLRPGLDVVFVGINPGLASAAAGHHYAGPTNHFWPLLHEAGFVLEPMTYENDARVLEFGIGLTNLVDRPTRGIDGLARAELLAGAGRLRAKLRRCRPRVVCFNGKAIAEAFLGGRCAFGRQPERWEGVAVYVLPCTSARAAAYQYRDKLRFFRELKRLVDRERAANGRARR